jgi:hypothetical protein
MREDRTVCTAVFPIDVNALGKTFEVRDGKESLGLLEEIAGRGARARRRMIGSKSTRLKSRSMVTGKCLSFGICAMSWG